MNRRIFMYLLMFYVFIVSLFLPSISFADGGGGTTGNVYAADPFPSKVESFLIKSGEIFQPSLTKEGKTAW